MLLTPYQISRISEKPFSRYLTVAILCSDLYITFGELISDKYETEFLRSGKQRIILRELTMLKLEKYVEEINDKCILCNKTLKSILIKIVISLPMYFLIIIQN
jgi:hypothetical protein